MASKASNEAIRIAKRTLRKAMKAEMSRIDGISIAEQSAAITAKLLSSDAYTKANSVSIYLSMPHGEVMTRDIVKDALKKDKQVYVPFIDKTIGFLDNRKPSREREGPIFMEMVSLHSKEDYERCEENKDKWGIPSVIPSTVEYRRKILEWQSNAIDWDGTGIWDGDHKSLPQGEFSKGQPLQQAWLDTIIVPGLAFDRSCRRLGHGKGFYDIFLKRYLDIKVVPSGGTKKMPFLVGLALEQQVLPEGQEIPTASSDWQLDALFIGNGSVIEKPKAHDKTVRKDRAQNFVEND